MRRVKLWKNSEHFQRWCATYCLAAEKRMRKIHDYKILPGLWILLRKLTEQNHVDINQEIEETHNANCQSIFEFQLNEGQALI